MGRRLYIGIVILASASLAGGCALDPDRLSDAERLTEARRDLAAVFAPQEPLHKALTLHNAFARALAYNLDQRVKLLEEAVAQNDLDLSKYDLLPKLVANAGYLTRNNVEASSSTSVITNTQSLEPSTSTDRNRRVADLTLSWNILDFGVSYFTARQNANRRLTAEEQRRRVVNNIFQDVRRAFWRAAAAQRLGSEVSSVIRTAKSALASSRALESEALRSPLDALRYQKALLELLRQLEGMQRQLAIAQIELAALINLPPGQPYRLAVPRGLHLRSVPVPLRRLERIALLRNPDIREQSYQTRITADEARKALLRLLPGINISAGPQYDSNSFLVNHHWYGAAVRMTESLINLAMLPQQLERNENARAVADLRRQAVSLAVLAKIHLAYRQYLSAAKEYEWSDRLAGVDSRLYQQIANQVASTAQGELERVSAQVSAITSAVRRYQSFADAQAALGRLYATVGIDPVSRDKFTALTLRTLNEQTRHAAANQEQELAKADAALNSAGDTTRLADETAAEPAPSNAFAQATSESKTLAQSSAMMAETPIQW